VLNTAEYTILGNSNATVSMILETLIRLHAEEINVRIIENIRAPDHLPFIIDGIHIDQIFHDQLEVNDVKHYENFILGVYKSRVKEIIYQFFRINYKIEREVYINLMYPGIQVAKSVSMGYGINVGPYTVIAPFASLGDFITINRQVSIGHHTSIEEFCTINPGVNIAGRCLIKKGVTIGMGTNIVDGIEIGEKSIVGAGSLVTKNIPAGVLAYGVPAKPIKKLV